MFLQCTVPIMDKVMVLCNVTLGPQRFDIIF